MGKYIAYAIIILAILFILELFQIVDIPYFDLPDFFSGKTEMIEKSKKAVDRM